MENFIRQSVSRFENVSGGLRNIVLSRSREFTSDAAELTELTEIISEPVLKLNDLKIETHECRCKNIENVIAYLETSDMKIKLEDADTVLVLQVQISETLLELTQVEVDELAKSCDKKSIVIVLTSRSGLNCFVYWKSRDLTNLFTIVHYKNEFSWEDREVYQFIAEFLGKSLCRWELGFIKKITINPCFKKLEIHLLADHRDYNLLLLAAEAGNADVVETLLKLNMSTEAPNKSTNAQSLAWNGRHSDVLLLLAQADLPYPVGIDINELSGKFKEFYKRIEDFHEAIKENDEHKVKYFIDRNKNLKHIFSTSNESAARIALNAKSLQIYDILIENNCLLAQNEYKEKIFKNLSKHDRRKVRDVHTRYSKEVKDKHINVLMNHSSISHNVQNEDEKLKIVRKAYMTLSQDHRLDTILRVIATSKKLKIVYDFNSDSVDDTDPTASEFSEGIMYLSGRIFIGAKQLLDEGTKNKSLGVMIHEFCHYAMDLTYENIVKPYTAKDKKRRKEFKKISKKCRKNSENEILINLVFDAYLEADQHAELIVRAPHLIALYSNQPEKMEEIVNIYPGLFDYFENRVIPDMMSILPKIEVRNEKMLEEKYMRNYKRKRNQLILLFFLIIGSLLYFVPFKNIIDNYHISNWTQIWNENMPSQVNFATQNPVKSESMKAMQTLNFDNNAGTIETTSHINRRAPIINEDNVKPEYNEYLEDNVDDAVNNKIKTTTHLNQREDEGVKNSDDEYYDEDQEGSADQQDNERVKDHHE